jgi:hypothetical protein
MPQERSSLVAANDADSSNAELPNDARLGGKHCEALEPKTLLRTMGCEIAQQDRAPAVKCQSSVPPQRGALDATHGQEELVAVAHTGSPAPQHSNEDTVPPPPLRHGKLFAHNAVLAKDEAEALGRSAPAAEAESEGLLSSQARPAGDEDGEHTLALLLDQPQLCPRGQTLTLRPHRPFVCKGLDCLVNQGAGVGAKLVNLTRKQRAVHNLLLPLLLGADDALEGETEAPPDSLRCLATVAGRV